MQVEVRTHKGPGRPRKRAEAVDGSEPVLVDVLAKELWKAKKHKTICWRMGSKGPLDGDWVFGGDWPDYPEGPYSWFLGETVGQDVFPGRIGSEGEDTEFSMCDVWANRDKYKALVFMIGDKDRGYCPDLFKSFIGSAEDIRSRGAEVVGYYAKDYLGAPLTAEEASKTIDEYGWEGQGGWRISSNSDKPIYDSQKDGTWFVWARPLTFILDPSTMKVIAADTENTSIDVLAELDKLQ